MEEKWLENAKAGNMKDMKETYQSLRSKGLLREVKTFKDSDGYNALMWATENGHLDVCQFLVREHLVDVNSKDVGGWNALHFAVMTDRPEIAELLLEETSIDVNAETNGGNTALHIAALCNNP